MSVLAKGGIQRITGRSAARYSRQIYSLTFILIAFSRAKHPSHASGSVRPSHSATCPPTMTPRMPRDSARLGIGRPVGDRPRVEHHDVGGIPFGDQSFR